MRFELKLAVQDIVEAAKNMYTIASSMENLLDLQQDEDQLKKQLSRKLCQIEHEIFAVTESLVNTRNCADELWPRDFASLRKTGQKDCEKVISLAVNESIILARVPYLGKLTGSYVSSPIDAIIFDALSKRSPGKFVHNGKINFYIVSIYPSDYSAGIPDPDNVASKALGDPLTQWIGIDDNACNVTYITMAIQTDTIPLGSYVLITPQEVPMLGKSQLAALIKKYLTERMMT